MTIQYCHSKDMDTTERSSLGLLVITCLGDVHVHVMLEWLFWLSLSAETLKIGKLFFFLKNNRKVKKIEIFFFYFASNNSEIYSSDITMVKPSKYNHLVRSLSCRLIMTIPLKKSKAKEYLFDCDIASKKRLLQKLERTARLQREIRHGTQSSRKTQEYRICFLIKTRF